MKRFIFAASLAALALSSCNKSIEGSFDDLIDDTIDQNLEVTFDPSLTAATRVTSDLFETNDCITVNAESTDSVAFVSGASYTYRNGIFSSDNPIMFESSTQMLRFYATYPAMEEISKYFSFSPSLDQSSGDNYEMSDLLLAKTSYTSDNCPYLDFYHVMTSIVVDIETPGKEGGVMTFYGAGNVIVDVDKFTTSATSTATSQNAYIAADNGTGSYKVILAPQTISAGTLMATYTVDGTTYEWRMESTKAYEQGCRYYVEWDLDENLISFDSYINGWQDGNGDSDSDSSTSGGVDVNGDGVIDDNDVADDTVDDSNSGYVTFSYKAQEATLDISNYLNIDAASSYVPTYALSVSADWITASTIESDYFTIAVCVAENYSTSSRDGYVDINTYTADGEAVTYNIYIVQSYYTSGSSTDANGDDDSDSDSTSSSTEPTTILGVTFDCIASTTNIENIDELSIYSTVWSSDDTWIIANVEESESGTPYLVLTVTASNSTDDRTGYVFIQNSNDDGTVETVLIEVLQLGAYSGTDADGYN